MVVNEASRHKVVGRMRLETLLILLRMMKVMSLLFGIISRIFLSQGQSQEVLVESLVCIWLHYLYFVGRARQLFDVCVGRACFRRFFQCWLVGWLVGREMSVCVCWGASATLSVGGGRRASGVGWQRGELTPVVRPGGCARLQ